MKQIKLLFAFFSAILQSVAQAAELSIYVVKKGDTSSTIAQKFVGEPIFTKDGSLSKLLALNPQIKDPHWIYVGQVITIDPEPQKSPSQASRSPSSDNAAESAVEPTQQNPIEKPLPPHDFAVSNELTQAPRELACQQEPPKHPEFWLWLGAGENFQYHQQSIPSVSGDAKFMNVQGPSLSVSAGFQTPQKNGAEVTYQQTPGRMDSSSTVEVRDGQFLWKSLTAEGFTEIEKWNFGFRYGLQHHQLPFMDLDTNTSSLTVRSNSISYLTLGVQRKVPLSQKLRGDWLFRYQYPMLTGSSNGDKFQVRPEFAFDGSLGAVYQFNDTVRLGLYWYGQWHQFGFDYGKQTQTLSGRQVLFYSNLDLRLGWEF